MKKFNNINEPSVWLRTNYSYLKEDEIVKWNATNNFDSLIDFANFLYNKYESLKALKLVLSYLEKTGLSLPDHDLAERRGLCSFIRTLKYYEIITETTFLLLWELIYDNPPNDLKWWPYYFKPLIVEPRIKYIKSLIKKFESLKYEND